MPVPPDDYANTLTDPSYPLGQLVVNGAGTGTLEALGDHDWFRVQLVGGVTYALRVEGRDGGRGSLEDPFLRVYDNAGTLLDQNDDVVSGIDHDSLITFVAPTSGTYYLEAAAFSNSYTGTYRISAFTTAPSDDFANTLDDITDPMGSLAANGSAFGNLEIVGDRDWFQVELTAGTRYLINLRGQQADQGTLEDPYLRLHNNLGTVLVENDDLSPQVNRDSQIIFTPLTTGTYYIEAGSFDDSYAGTYLVSISINSTPPDPPPTNQFVPEIVSNGGGSNATVSVLENATAVTTVVATDADPGTTLTYSISGGVDAALFQINGSTGALSFKSASNFEQPADANHDNNYIVRVRASDGDLFDDQTLTITVVDLPEPVYWLASVDIGLHPAGWLPVSTGDFNNDGTSDVLWFNNAIRHVDLWKIANGKWAGSVDIGTHPPGYQPALSGDFNGDGTDDVLWYNASNGDVDVWKIANGQWAGSTTIGLHPLGWQPVGAGDFNADGTDDVLWYNPSDGNTEIWKVSNGQWAGSVNIGLHPLGWQPAGNGDFNHDGTSDVLWYNPTTGDVDLWKISNGQWAGSVNIGLHPLGWTPAGVGDFNEDGTSDLAWFNATTGQVEVWLIANGHWSASVLIGAHPLGWSPAGIGDFDHNGVSDIFWREANSNRTDTWLLGAG